MKIYSGFQRGAGLWTLDKSVAQRDARYSSGQKVYSATLSGTVLIVPPDWAQVFPRKAQRALSDAIGQGPDTALRDLKKSSFFDAYEAIVMLQGIIGRGEKIVIVMDADILFNVK